MNTDQNERREAEGLGCRRGSSVQHSVEWNTMGSRPRVEDREDRIVIVRNEEAKHK